MEDPLTQFRNMVNDIPDDALNYMQTSFGKLGVKISYERDQKYPDGNPLYSRFMLGTFVRSSKFWFPGIIIARVSSDDSQKTYKAVSLPSPPPISQYKTTQLYNHWPTTVTATCANDGTTVTLYYFNNKWVISTYRGYQVNDFIWAANKTYQEIVDEVLNQYPGFSYEKLDKKCAYSIGFNHYLFHPFQAEQKNITAWFIQSVDMEKFNDGNQNYAKYDCDIGLPMQEVKKFSNLRALLESAKNAYKDYIDNKTVNYGYLVKVKKRQYLVESSLLKNIRHIFYSNKFNMLNPVFNKEKYIITHAFLDTEKHSVFLNMFPQFKKEFDCLKEKMSDLIRAIYIMSNSSVKPTTTLDVVAREIAMQISKVVSLNTKKETDAFNILYTYLYDVKYTSMLYSVAFR